VRQTWTGLFGDYSRFHFLELISGDVDPVYRVLQQMAPELTRRQMALLSFLHVAFYDLGSALRAYGHLGGRADHRVIEQVIGFPTGTERRGMRDKPELRKHLTHLFDIDEAYDGLHRWAERFPTYGELFGALQSIYGNGRWAAYKSCELLSWSMRSYQPTARMWEPTDMGHAFSSGPRHGLQLLWPEVLPTGHTANAVTRLDRISDELVRALQELGLTASHATCETTLCDFNSLFRGRYYSGHDIHQMGDQLRRALAKADAGAVAVEVGLGAAQEVFGLVVDESVDKPRKKLYKATGAF
jgi:hypothetical protein